jgi:hypothetical protein
MEVVIGFAVGYWVGTRQGREGLTRALDSARAIWESPETRHLLQEAGPVIERLQQARGGARAAILNTVVEEFRERRSGRAA